MVQNWVISQLEKKKEDFTEIFLLIYVEIIVQLGKEDAQVELEYSEDVLEVEQILCKVNLVLFHDGDEDLYRLFLVPYQGVDSVDQIIKTLDVLHVIVQLTEGLVEHFLYQVLVLWVPTQQSPSDINFNYVPIRELTCITLGVILCYIFVSHFY